MSDFFESYIDSFALNNFNEELFGNNRVVLNAVKKILPLIIENELTPRQKQCLKMKYFDNLTQEEIGAKLGLTQPTVCKCVKRAKETVGRYLEYSLIAADTVASSM